MKQQVNRSLTMDDCWYDRNGTKRKTWDQHYAILSRNESDNENNNNSVDILPMQYPVFDERALIFVVIYCCVFVVAVIGNVTVFVNLFRSRRRKSRINLMIIHLTIADLIVTFLMLPFEIGWRLTIQWMGGNIACKIMFFFRAFGLYLSSNILICISFDRYFAVVHPLMVRNKRSRGKLMLYCAWLASTIYAFPQIFIFHVENHPQFSNFTQCVSFGFFASPSHEFVYNIVCLMAMYFVPLIVIIATYASILYAMWRKANNQSDASGVKDTESETKPRNNCNKNTWAVSDTSLTTSGPKQRDKIILRRSDMKCVERARHRTLKMTIIIIIVFLVCWTPYVVMSFWYHIDRNSAQKVPMWIQEVLFMMAVSNSCMNPIVYGRFTVRTLVGSNNGKRSKQQTYTLCCCSNGDKHNDQMLEQNDVKFTRRQYARGCILIRLKIHSLHTQPDANYSLTTLRRTRKSSSKVRPPWKGDVANNLNTDQRLDDFPSTSKSSCHRSHLHAQRRRHEKMRNMMLQLHANDCDMGVQPPMFTSQLSAATQSGSSDSTVKTMRRQYKDPQLTLNCNKGPMPVAGSCHGSDRDGRLHVAFDLRQHNGTAALEYL